MSYIAYNLIKEHNQENIIQLTLKRQLTELKESLAKVYAEIDTNTRLAEVYSQFDHLALYKLDRSREQLNRVAVDLLTQIDDIQREMERLQG